MDPDLYTVAAGDDETSAAAARAMSQALRRQGNYAILGGTSPINAVRAQSPGLMKDAWQQEDRLSEMPRQRLTQSLLKEQADKIRQATADETDPQMAAGYAGFIKGDDNAMNAAMTGMRPGNFPKMAALAEKRRASNEGNAMRGYVGQLTAQARQGNQDQTDERAKAIGDAIIQGKQSPDMKGLFRFGAPVRAYLAAQGYDHATATNEWVAQQKYLAATNGPTLVRMQAAIGMIPQQTAKIRSLWEQWKQEASVSGIKQFNRAQLFASKQTGGKAGALANALDAQIADLTSELGFVYTGGTAPTDHSFKLAGANLNSQWDDASVQLALKNIDDAAIYRRNAMNNTVALGTGGANRYAPQPIGNAPDTSGNVAGKSVLPLATDAGKSNIAKKYGL